MGDPIFIPWHPTFESSVGQSTLIHEIVPKTVTLRKEDTFRATVTPYGEDPPVRHHKTMFHEINMIPPKSTHGQEIRTIVKRPPPRKGVSKREFLSRTLEVFMDVVERAWIPKRFHIVLHSGGYDSRLLSYAIRELYAKNGNDWLGDLLFLEIQGEDEHSCAALEAEGWNQERFVACHQEGLDRHCDFSNAWRRQNCGMYPKPFSHFYEPIAWLQDTGQVPGDDSQLQTWTGYFANDMAHALINGPGLRWAIQTLPYHTYFLAPIKGACVAPYLALDLIEFLWSHGRGQEESQVQNYRRHILEWIAPSVAAIPNPQRGAASSTLLPALFKRVGDDFQNSWYGQNVPVTAKQPTTVQFRTWWGHWGLASFCEELLRREHKIRLPR